jgi:hypothetical protein
MATWEIQADHDGSREEVIEAAVNTIFGMSLVHSVEVIARVSPLVSNVCIRAGNGDEGLITCREEEVVQLRDDILAVFNAELFQMPPYAGRKPVTNGGVR